jgi:hypothetical protein
VKYLRIDVHVKTSVWCLLDEAGQIAGQGKVATTAPALTALLKPLTGLRRATSRTIECSSETARSSRTWSKCWGSAPRARAAS